MLTARSGALLDRIALLLFVFLALLRIAYAVQAVDRTPVLRQPLADSIVYAESARSIAAGRLVSDEPFYRAPLYQYVIAPFYAAEKNPGKAIVAFQIALGIGILVLTWRLARTLYGPAPALLALALTGLYGALAATETKLLGTTLGIFLGTLSLWILIRARDRRRFFLAGFVLGLAALVRPDILLIALALVAASALSRLQGRERLRCGVLPLLLGLVLAIAPATGHNLLAGDFVLISSNGGMTFYHGNNRLNRSGLLKPGPLADLPGNAVQQAARDRQRASELAGRPLRPSESSAFWFRQALREMGEDPAAALGLMGQKLRRFVSASEYADNYSYRAERKQVWWLRLFAIPFPLLLTLAVAAVLLRPPRRREELFVLFFAALGFVVCMLFYVGSRYRCESVPALAVLSGSLLAAWPAAKPARKLLAVGASVLLLILASSPPGIAVLAQDSMAQAQWAGALERDGRPDEARAHYEAATQRHPANAPAWSRWAALETGTRGADEGLRILDSGIEAGADGPLLRAQRGTTRVALGDYAGAEDDLRIACGMDPEEPAACLNLAACLVRRGADEEARPLLLLPALGGDPIARYYRGLLEARAGRWPEAIEQFDAALAAGASDPRPAVLRAMAWIRIGRRHEAADWLHGWLVSERIDLSAEQTEAVLDLLGTDPSGAWFDREILGVDGGERLTAVLGSVLRAWRPVR